MGFGTGLENSVHEVSHKYEENVIGIWGKKKTCFCSGEKFSNIDTPGNLENRKCTNELCDLAEDTSRHSAERATWRLPAAYYKMRV